jgi:hypothetical protein
MRYQSKAMFGDLPLICVAYGPDLQAEQNHGRAVGVIAIGDVAVGIIAVGAVAAGVVAIGGFGLGLVTIGGFALGFVAMGSFFVGGVAAGGLGSVSARWEPIGPHPQGGLSIRGAAALIKVAAKSQFSAATDDTLIVFPRISPTTRARCPANFLSAPRLPSSP